MEGKGKSFSSAMEASVKATPRQQHCADCGLGCAALPVLSACVTPWTGHLLWGFLFFLRKRDVSWDCKLRPLWRFRNTSGSHQWMNSSSYFWRETIAQLTLTVCGSVPVSLSFSHFSSFFSFFALSFSCFMSSFLLSPPPCHLPHKPQNPQHTKSAFLQSFQDCCSFYNALMTPISPHCGLAQSATAEHSICFQRTAQGAKSSEVTWVYSIQGRSSQIKSSYSRLFLYTLFSPVACGKWDGLDRTISHWSVTHFRRKWAVQGRVP